MGMCSILNRVLFGHACMVNRKVWMEMVKTIYTSYFAKVKYANIEPERLFAVSRTCPPDFPGTRLLDFAPSAGLLGMYRNLPTFGWRKFIHGYMTECLNKKSLSELLDVICDEAILICWEKSGTFCHRHIIADWIMEQCDISVTEL